MGMNNYFPATYQYAQPNYNNWGQNTVMPAQQMQQTVPQVQQTPNIQPTQVQPNQGNAVNWVQGIEGAKAHYVAPGGTAMLMDSEESVFYIKSTDFSGMPMPLRVFDYKERAYESNSSPTVDMSGYVTKEYFENILEEKTNRINEELETKLKELDNKRKQK